MPATAWLYRAATGRFRPLGGGVDVDFAATPDPGATYPPSYGAVGSYRPSASTTGVPAGTTLTRYDGNMTVSTAGAVIDGLDIYGRVTVTAANVTIQRCRIRGPGAASSNTACVVATAAAVQNLLIRDCEIVPQTPSIWVNGVNGHDFTMRRCEIRNVVDGWGLFNTNLGNVADTTVYQLNVVLSQNWLHDFVYFTPDPNHASDNQTHNDGAQIQGGRGATIIGNSIEAYYGPAGSHQPSNVGTSPSGHPSPALNCILMGVNTGKGGEHVIEDNWLMGGYLPLLGSTSPGTSWGRAYRNKFSGDSLITGGIPQTILIKSDQTIDAGEGTVNQNVFLDGTPVLVRRNG